MENNTKIQIAIILALTSFGSYAQETENDYPELVTDRPDQTESPMVIPPGWIQYETGFLMENDKFKVGGTNVSTKNTSYLNNLFRIGIVPAMEIRIVAGEYATESITIGDSTVSISGFTPIAIGAKFKILKEDSWKPEMAFLFHLGLPTGLEDFRSTEVAIDFRFALEHSINDWLGIGVNLGGEWDGETSRPAAIYTFVLGFSFSEKIGGYAEVYGEIPSKAASIHKFDGGLTYSIKPNFQLDLSGGIGITDNAPDSFVSVGVSVRLPH